MMEIGKNIDWREEVVWMVVDLLLDQEMHYDEEKRNKQHLNRIFSS